MKKITTTLVTPNRNRLASIRTNVKRRTRQATDIFARGVRAFNKIFTRPIAFILLALAILLALNEQASSSKPTDSILYKALDKLPKGDLKTYALSHKPQIIAFTAYIAVTSAALPARQLFPGILISALLAFIVPEKSNWEYVTQTVLLFLFVALRKPTDRIIIIAAGVVAWAAGWLTIQEKEKKG